MVKHLLLAACFVIVSCSTSFSIHEFISKKAAEKFGGNYSTSFNSDSSFVICSNKILTKAADTFSFFVIDVKKQAIVFNDQVQKGNLIWLNDSNIKVTWTPGIIKGDESKNSDLEYVLNLITLKKSHLKLENKNQ